MHINTGIVRSSDSTELAPMSKISGMMIRILELGSDNFKKILNGTYSGLLLKVDGLSETKFVCGWK